MKQTSASKVSLAFAKHDHTRCSAQIARDAELLCEAKGLRLTDLRREALEMLSETHKALGAYDIVERFKESGRRATPPMAYRALSFLVDHGFAHRIESLNAFVACCGPEHSHHPAFLICTECRTVAEIQSDSARTAIAPTIEPGFEVERSVLELLGRCPQCIEKTNNK